MKRLLIPLVLLLLGLGGGVGAGLMLAPAPVEEPTAELANPCGVPPGGEAVVPGEEEHAIAEGEHAEGEPAEDGEAATGEDGLPTHDYVKLNNQFVVPLLNEGRVEALVLMSLSLEVPPGKQETTLALEPKLRDAFLQVLFDHANTGGFDGLYTASSAMRGLRSALVRGAQDAVGELVTDVLILDLVRQDK
ncbi:flagellar basal body-associated FliL family protein [Rubellimicrobium aerolatum]|uniref:Flagellar protein FliL n=1 Tax=Rubellimicrobium aerolatum TaxID=490979 RepID=A0ABW0S9U0_9RHOB|nr:flagellar basal body-associated FliL family protein [Rubellimicrobium aerolatum]MBP1805073.1 hypothetical protein [Rubellimicrobium aerolatum]